MFRIPSPLEEISHPLLDRHQVRMFIKRDDLIHPEVSGNKWRKLKYNIQAFHRSGQSQIVTFGGAFSNHIAATAAACHHFGIPCFGVVRGDELHANANPTLQMASKQGMDLLFVSRENYRKYREEPELLDEMLPDSYVIPEGGGNSEGIRGCAEIIDEIDVPFDAILTPVGTATTLLGLIKGLKGTKKVIGYSALKGDFMQNQVKEMSRNHAIDYGNYELSSDYHFGGYGKSDELLVNFMHEIHSETGIKLDPVYTGKAFFGVWKEIKTNKFDKQTLVFLHTGGLQGIPGHNQKKPQIIHY